MNFYKAMTLSFARSLDSFYPNNFDWEIRRLKFYRKAILFFEKTIDFIHKVTGIPLSVLILRKNAFYLHSIDRFEATYNSLSDEKSKERFIELLTYRILGFTKVKLSLNNDTFWQSRAKVDSLRCGENIPVKGYSSGLDLYDLNSAGYDLKLFFLKNGIFVDFILQQYNYRDFICVYKDDVVIDAGGCWGDTALYFAARGASKVFVFEFIPSNLEVFHRNVSINSHYKDTIKLIEMAVWESSGVNLAFDDTGPSSRAGIGGSHKVAVQTISIDDFVREEGISKIDFIKMDIEGAELSALKGASNTIKTQKPKLAISVYHKPEDLAVIPTYIKSLNPTYKFYLDYYTIFGDEIILYAINEQ